MNSLSKTTPVGTRIARNSFLLLVRMSVLMLVNLYAVRVIMQRLGVEDFGIYQQVAGIVTTMTCFNTVLAVSIQRFYNYAIGLRQDTELRRIFSASININFALVVLFLILFESIGLWFLNVETSIPLIRIKAANWAYQAAILTFFCTLIQVPFIAFLLCYEDMGRYALISTIECFMRLAVALTIGTFCIDPLEYYAYGLTSVAIIILLIYATFCFRNYEECQYVCVKDIPFYKKLFSFSGWTFCGTLAGVGIFQGNTLLISHFFNAIVSAAFGVAMQINAAFQALTNSIVLAVRPIMIQSYAEGNRDRLMQIFYMTNKFLFLVLLVMGIPLIVIMPQLLQLWLGYNDEIMISYARLIIVFIILLSLHHPITIIVQAAGEVKRYSLWCETVMLMCIPVSWIAIKCGGPAHTVMFTMIIVTVITHINRLRVLNSTISYFSYHRYFATLLCPWPDMHEVHFFQQSILKRLKHSK